MGKRPPENRVLRQRYVSGVIAHGSAQRVIYRDHILARYRFDNCVVFCLILRLGDKLTRRIIAKNVPGKLSISMKLVDRQRHPARHRPESWRLYLALGFEQSGFDIQTPCRSASLSIEYVP